MFPDARFLGFDLYYWMFLLGIVSALVLARVFCDRVGVCAKVFNISVFSAVGAIVFGYVSAVLFESFWEFLETGEFVWGTGATFYGGLIGAAVVYFALYFLFGKLFCKQKEHIAQFFPMLSFAMVCVALAHAIGRLGCLFNGCCYGAETDAWYGIEMYIGGVWQKRVPVQLFECIFLFLLTAVMIVLQVRFRFEGNAGVYAIAYGIWRFSIEFARADDRGISGVGALSPSQLLSVLLVIFGVAFMLFYFFYVKKRKGGGNAHESP